MKVTFEGWDRVEYLHEHPVTPVAGHKRICGKKGDPIQLVSATRAHGRIGKLGLSGDFRVTFDFDPEELRNWLRKYIQFEPEAGARLISEMQGEVFIRLLQKAKQDAIGEITAASDSQ